MLLILSGASGVGKTSLAQLLENHGFARSVSYTTRPKRDLEKHGQDYFFVNTNEFQCNLDNNFFLEHTKQFDNFYGTSSNVIESYLQKNQKIVACLSVHGFLSAKKKWPTLTNGIYLLPPEENILAQRIQQRNTDNFDLAQRLNNVYAQAQEEKIHYDHVLEPDTLSNLLLKVLNLYQ